ncbi:MAG: hypothetical protein HFE79_12685 [Ruminiclostridium sp.]|nr:hypothetical protein [Ruminiclostridium sp.]
MWRYKSPIGNIYIKRLSDGSYGMEHNGTVWEACDTPQAEADNVYMKCTGCSDWDLLDTSKVNVTRDLSEWEEI